MYYVCMCAYINVKVRRRIFLMPESIAIIRLNHSGAMILEINAISRRLIANGRRSTHILAIA